MQKKYDSTYEFIQDVDRANYDWATLKRGTQSVASNKSHDKWTGTVSFAEAVQNTYDGVDMLTVDSIRAKAFQVHEKTAQGFEYDVAGDYVDVGLFVAGEPECMVDFRNVKKAAKYVHILVNMSDGSGSTNKQIAKRGAIISAAIDRMEHNGSHRVKVSMVRSCVGYSQDSLMVTVKEYSRKLNVQELTGALHTGFYRRVYFAYVEKFKIKASNGGYGNANEIRPEDFTDGSENQLIVNGISHSSNRFHEQLKDANTPEQYAACAEQFIKMVENVT